MLLRVRRRLRLAIERRLPPPRRITQASASLLHLRRVTNEIRRWTIWWRRQWRSWR